MKYSILELDKINNILKEKVDNAKVNQHKIIDVTNVNPFWDDEGYIESQKIIDLYDPAIRKIDEYFNEAVNEFIKEALDEN